MALTLNICQTVATTVAEQGTINTTSIQRNIWSLFIWRQSYKSL